MSNRKYLNRVKHKLDLLQELSVTKIKPRIYTNLGGDLHTYYLVVGRAVIAAFNNYECKLIQEVLGIKTKHFINYDPPLFIIKDIKLLNRKRNWLFDMNDKLEEFIERRIKTKKISKNFLKGISFADDTNIKVKHEKFNSIVYDNTLYYKDSIFASVIFYKEDVESLITKCILNNPLLIEDIKVLFMKNYESVRKIILFKSELFNDAIANIHMKSDYMDKPFDRSLFDLKLAINVIGKQHTTLSRRIKNIYEHKLTKLSVKETEIQKHYELRVNEYLSLETEFKIKLFMISCVEKYPDTELDELFHYLHPRSLFIVSPSNFHTPM